LCQSLASYPKSGYFQQSARLPAFSAYLRRRKPDAQQDLNHAVCGYFAFDRDGSDLVGWPQWRIIGSDVLVRTLLPGRGFVSNAKFNLPDTRIYRLRVGLHHDFGRAGLHIMTRQPRGLCLVRYRYLGCDLDTAVGADISFALQALRSRLPSGIFNSLSESVGAQYGSFWCRCLSKGCSPLTSNTGRQLLWRWLLRQHCTAHHQAKTNKQNRMPIPLHKSSHPLTFVGENLQQSSSSFTTSRKRIKFAFSRHNPRDAQKDNPSPMPNRSLTRRYLLQSLLASAASAIPLPSLTAVAQAQYGGSNGQPRG
jgi:hypothetical protein